MLRNVNTKQRRTIMKRLMFTVMLLMLFVPCLALAQEYPPIYEEIFGEEFLLAVVAVIALTKLVRNIINVKGALAVVVTAVLSLAVALIQYLSVGVGYALAVGVATFVASAGIFKATKSFGKKVNPKGKILH